MALHGCKKNIVMREIFLKMLPVVARPRLYFIFESLSSIKHTANKSGGRRIQNSHILPRRISKDREEDTKAVTQFSVLFSHWIVPQKYQT